LPQNVNDIFVVENEESLIFTFILLVFKLDPDIVAGYDIEKGSLTYLAQRAWQKNIDIMNFMSRSPKDLESLFELINFNEFITENNECSIFTSRNMSSMG